MATFEEMAHFKAANVEARDFARFEAEHPNDLDAPLALLEEQMRDNIVHPACIVEGPLFDYMRDLTENTELAETSQLGKFRSSTLLQEPSEIVRDVAVKFMVFSVARLKPLFISGTTRPMMQALESASSAQHSDARVGNVINWTMSGARITTVNPREGSAGQPTQRLLTEACMSVVPSHPHYKEDQVAGELTVKTVDHEIELLRAGRQINARLYQVTSPFTISQSRNIA